MAAPGSYIEIYGSQLSATTRGWADRDFTGRTAPTSLDEVTITINGQRAPVSYLSPGQVNAQIPDTVAVGTAMVVVTTAGQSSAPAMLRVVARQPGLLESKPYVRAVHSATGRLVSTSDPARPLETLGFYGTGFGPVSGTGVAGQIAVGQTTLADPFTMTIGNFAAMVQYAGLAPGLVGVYQFNVVVPISLAGGDQTLVTSPATAQTLVLPVGAAVTSFR